MALVQVIIICTNATLVTLLYHTTVCISQLTVIDVDAAIDAIWKAAATTTPTAPNLDGTIWMSQDEMLQVCLVIKILKS